MYLLAQALSAQQKEVPALELLVRARKISPQNTDVLFLLARLLMSQSFIEDAVRLLEEGVKMAPQRADFHVAPGRVLLQHCKGGQSDPGISESSPDGPFPRSYASLGMCYRHLEGSTKPEGL